MSPRDLPDQAADRNALFAVLALQMDLLTREALIQGLNSWVLDRSRPLGQVLVERGSLGLDLRAVVEALVDKQIDRHGGDAGKCLEAVRTQGPVLIDLGQITDPEVRAVLHGFDSE